MRLAILGTMQGPWVWSDPAKRQSVLDEIRKAHLDRILNVLARSQGRGLSNAEMDSALGAFSMVDHSLAADRA